MLNILIKLLENKIVQFQDTDRKKIFILKGFPVEIIKKISEKYYFINNIDDLINEEKINLDFIADKKYLNSMLKKILNLERDLNFIIIEELLLIRDKIDLSILNEIDLIILNNNFYSEIPNQTNYDFKDINKELDLTNTIGEENKIFEYFYVDCNEKYGINFLKYKDIELSEFENVKVTNIFDDNILNKIDLKKYILEEPLENLSNSIEFPLTDNQDDKDYCILKNDIFFLKNPTKTNLVINKNLLDKISKNYIEELKILIFLYNISNVELNIYYKSNKLKIEKYRDSFREILEKYWKSDSFRELIFYKNPDINKEKISISQGNLIEFIVRNCENSYYGKDFQDIYITAPTGSGKSILFQIPAIYIADEYNLVTIVVTPLKSLMYDQVSALKEMGINNAAYINSDISYFKREEIIDDIKNGNISILYLSPELLLSYDLDFFIGDRKLGLLVIDESHLVTTWGRDFRIDYWYLGNYIQKLRKFHKSDFPVLALTATAVYLGEDDVVFETISSLNLKNTQIFLGNVVRNEINFHINKFEYSGNHEIAKFKKTYEIICESINEKRKTIVYFPWTNQIEYILKELPEKFLGLIGKYYGNVDAYEKEITADDFKTGKILVILATKAFGMGVDIKDIKMIYHFSPSGNLADYVQEIGRVARDKTINGISLVDFHAKDLKYTKILYGLSSIKQFQLLIVLQKIYDLYLLKGKKNNMLTSVEDFGFIFFGKREEMERKVKSALLLLEKDLLLKHRYNLLIVRPRNIYANVFACVSEDIEKDFVIKYGKYSKMVKSFKENLLNCNDKLIKGGFGNIYEIELNKIWENYFSEYSFPEVKRMFFNKELFLDFKDKIFPRYLLKIKLRENIQQTYEKIEFYFQNLRNVFYFFNHKFFTRLEFESKLNEYLKNRPLSKKISNVIITIYSSIINGTTNNLESGTFLQEKTFENSIDKKYKIFLDKFDIVMHSILKNFNAIFENQNNFFEKYISSDDAHKNKNIKVAYILEAFSLGSYELSGGRLPQIFIRISDPFRINLILKNGKYKNDILRNIEERHSRGIKIMEQFFGSKMSNEERWNYIENYFLGEKIL